MATLRNENDPVIRKVLEKLGLDHEVLPPLDAVHGYYQKEGEYGFRLWHTHMNCYLKGQEERIIVREDSPYVKDGTMLVLRAGDGYYDDVEIICPDGGKEKKDDEEGSGKRMMLHSHVRDFTSWHWR